MNENGAREVTLGLVQMAMSADAASNLDKALQMTSEAAERGANIVVLPELFRSPYFCQYQNDKAAYEFAEPIPGDTTERLSKAAAELGIVLVGGSLYEKSSEGRYFNTACIFGPKGELIGSYRKSHIPHDPDFYEQDYFEPGDTGIRVHDTPYGKISVLICYDQWFPEAARIATLRGAELLIYPTAIGTSANVPPVTPEIPEDWELMWRSAQVGHAAANCVYVAAVNRVGGEGQMKFFGGSFVADPSARLLVKADDSEQILLARCRLDHVRRMQDSWRFLKERKPSLYEPLSKEKP